jgi:hypothetical protein
VVPEELAVRLLEAVLEQGDHMCLEGNNASGMPNFQYY